MTRSPTSHELSTSTTSRRRALQVGVLGAMGLTLPQLLLADKLAAADEVTTRERGAKAGEAAGRAKQPAKSCIFIHQYGGLSQLDSWDPKPNAPQEVRGPYLPIATVTPGFQVGELMPRLAKLSESYCVIRSMSHHVPVHDVANKMLLGGSDAPAADAPAFGSVVSKLRPATENIPSYVWLQKFGGGAAPPEATYLTGGFLGMGHAPLVIGHGHEDNPATEGFRVQAFDTASDVSLQRLQHRWQLRQQLDPAARQDLAPRPATFEQFQHRAYDLLHGEQARVAFDVTQESPETRDRYGRNPMGQNLLLARRLVEAGVRLVSVVAWTGLAPGDKFMSLETWDMHGNAGIGIFDNGWNGLGWALPRADQSVAALLEDLQDRGLLESTLVVLIGEFGRTPRISHGAKAIGRDHWPNCYSAMLAGAGIRGGNIVGSSDVQAAYVQDRPVSLADFTSTLYHALGFPPATRLSPDNFTRPASDGTPMLDLF